MHWAFGIMKRLSKIIIVLVLLLLAFAVVWVRFLPADSPSNAAAVQVVLCGFTNDSINGKCVRFAITNVLSRDVLYGQTIEVKARTGWPTYQGGSRLPHSTFAELEAQDSVTLTATVPTNGASWRVSVVYQDLQTRRGKDFLATRTTIADTLHPKDKYLGHWIWSREINE